MIELFFSALITLLPDYLYRRYVQGKRIGHEITLFSVWYELRWGITGCVMLAITLATVIFYFHPSASNVTALFRTVSIHSDERGIVEEVYVRNNQYVKAGEPIFRLETSRERAAAETARRRIAEIDAESALAKYELDVARANIVSAEGELRKARDELERREELLALDSPAVTAQEMEILRANVQSREGELEAAQSSENVVQARISSLLPAQRVRSEAEMVQAQTEIDSATVYAGVDGVVTQFVLQPGDLVNPVLRPAGILVPDHAARGTFQASFQQLAGQVLSVGMLMEITCPSKPLTVIPMIATEIQDVIATGQLRQTDQLIDLQERRRRGTILVILKPVFDGHADSIFAGSNCFGVAYSNHGPAIEAGEIRGLRAFALRLVDGMGIVNTLVIRIQAILLPIRSIVFGR